MILEDVKKFGRISELCFVFLCEHVQVHIFVHFCSCVWCFSKVCTAHCLFFSRRYTTYRSAFLGYFIKPKKKACRDKAVRTLFSLSGLFPLAQEQQHFSKKSG